MKCTNCGSNVRTVKFGNGWVTICGKCDNVVFSEETKLKEEKNDDILPHPANVTPSSLAPR